MAVYSISGRLVRRLKGAGAPKQGFTRASLLLPFQPPRYAAIRRRGVQEKNRRVAPAAFVDGVG
jgi:hypothetical protein